MKYDDKKISEIEEMLSEVYDGAPKDKIGGYALALYLSAFYEKRELDDLFCIVYEYEDELSVDKTQSFYVFDRIVELLDPCPDTAKRLYKNFISEYDNFTTYLKLMLENSQYLNSDELASAKQKAHSLFDKALLETYGI